MLSGRCCVWGCSALALHPTDEDHLYASDENQSLGARLRGTRLDAKGAIIGLPGFPAMLRSLRDHMVELEMRIQALRDKLTLPNLTEEERARTNSQIQVAELALSHYMKAFELEQKIA